MCKAVDRAMRITDIRVTHKSGGKSGDWARASVDVDVAQDGG